MIGPCIRPPCYEFAERDLRSVVEVVGEGVVSRTSKGAPALDLAAGVQLALTAQDIDAWRDTGICTACSPSHWSHRRSGDRQRQALVAAPRG